MPVMSATMPLTWHDECKSTAIYGPQLPGCAALVALADEHVAFRIGQQDESHRPIEHGRPFGLVTKPL